MTIDGVRRICRSFPGVTEDLKWGADLAFCTGGKMFCVDDNGVGTRNVVYQDL